MKGRRGADVLVAALAAAGVRRLFTLSGNHVMAVFDYDRVASAFGGHGST